MGDTVGLVFLEGALTRGLEEIVVVGEFGSPIKGEWVFEYKLVGVSALPDC